MMKQCMVGERLSEHIVRVRHAGRLQAFRKGVVAAGRRASAVSRARRAKIWRDVAVLSHGPTAIRAIGQC